MKEKQYRIKKRLLLAFCVLGLAAAAGGCAEKGVSHVLAQKLEKPKEEAVREPDVTDDADLRFRERFYALSPDSLKIMEPKAAGDAASQGEEGCGVALGEFPQEGVFLYGYMDPEKPRQGVMIQYGDNVSYFPDIVYMPESFTMPDIYADSSMITASFHTGGQGENERDRLFVFFRNQSGTVSGQEFTAEDFLGQIENRFSLSYETGENKGKLVGQDGKLIAEVDLSWADGAAVTGLNVTDRLHFIPGKPITAEVEIGIVAEGQAPYYGEHITVTAPVEVRSENYENGTEAVSFLVGEVTKKEESVQE